MANAQKQVSTHSNNVSLRFTFTWKSVWLADELIALIAIGNLEGVVYCTEEKLFFHLVNVNIVAIVWMLCFFESASTIIHNQQTQKNTKKVEIKWQYHNGSMQQYRNAQLFKLVTKCSIDIPQPGEKTIQLHQFISFSQFLLLFCL